MEVFKSDENAFDRSSEIAGEIREFARQEVAPAHASDGEQLPDDNIALLLQRVSGHSVQELDRLISELRAIRNNLQSEGERVSRQVIEYATLSQAAMQSINLIAESLSTCKKGSGAPSINK